MIDARYRGISSAEGVSCNHLPETAGGIELHSTRRRRGVSGQYRAVLAEQGKTRAAVSGKLFVESLERLRRHRDFRHPGEGARTVEAPFAYRKDRLPGHLQHLADMDIRIRGQLRLQ